LAIAKKAYAGIVKRFIKVENGQTNLYGTVKVSGLGGNPYRDGSFEYYMSEPVIANDPKGIGAFLLASTEMEKLPTLSTANGKTVLLDRYFNSEKRKDAAGRDVYWHYVWEERSNSGFYTWGNIFERYGAKLSSLDVAPTAANLKNASVYIIVDPDHKKDNPNPNYVSDNNVKVITDWVKAGGKLILMANDSANCDLQHFNKLAEVFGIRFTDKSINMVKNDVFEQGAVLPGSNNPIFKTTKKMYLKEVSALELHSPKNANATKDGDVIIATAKSGKGIVFAVGDPWLYNEYVDGRKPPSEYENYKAAEDLVKWLLKK
ncbi:MAG TPA: glycoside hydrolase family 88 protein, partial [Chitinophagaceae bacterium]|nr:glycoside hydrolase family 88 protein [Chitinophagaceae bacterium]